jgi:hypothetical protein
MNEHVEEYLRRIHQASGVPTEQAIDAADGVTAQPRTGPLDSTVSRQGEM